MGEAGARKRSGLLLRAARDQGNEWVRWLIGSAV